MTDKKVVSLKSTESNEVINKVTRVLRSTETYLNSKFGHIALVGVLENGMSIELISTEELRVGDAAILNLSLDRLKNSLIQRATNAKQSN